MTERLTVCIVTYGRPEFLRRCLGGLRALQGPPPEVVVVDASRASAQLDAEASYPGVHYVHAPALAGWMTKARNEALRWARGEVIAFIDDDVVVRPLWAQALVAAFADPAVSAVGGRTCNGIAGEEHYSKPIGILRADGTLTDGFAASPGNPVRIDHGIGANMTFRRSVLAELGGFRDDYPGTALREDTDIFLRVRAIGGMALFVPDAVVDHRPAPHVHGARFDTRYKLYGRRNHVVLLARDQGLGSPMLRRWIRLQFHGVGSARGVGARARRLIVTVLGIAWGLGASARLAQWRPTPAQRVGPKGAQLRRILSAPRLAPTDSSPPQGKPTFALVIPTYQRGDLLREAVDSALAQTRPFDQIIVVADGLDDPAVSVLAGLPVEVVSIPRGRESVARNTGVGHARTSWVCFLDDDDLLHPGYLERINAELESSPDVRALNANFWSFSSSVGPATDFEATSYQECMERSAGKPPKNPREYMYIEGRSFDLLLERMRGAMTTTAVERGLLIAAGGFPVEHGPAADWAMYLNVARLAEWRFLGEPLAFSRDHPDTVTRTSPSLVGITALRVIHDAWQPSTLPTPPHRPLDAYRSDYRRVLAWVFASCWRTREFDIFREALGISRQILTRRRDILFAARPLWLRRAYWARRWHARS
ncbi:glycosyltransferase [Agromyces sp. H66]|uniref:glycosyltransferase n=1 Tax=Agromyces sp. H66 TaxID=2529859 RepID=UPI0010AB4B97|nr:glycosyltransferase [Agromyces sp. H66]